MRAAPNDNPEIQVQSLPPQAHTATSQPYEQPKQGFDPHNPSPQMYPPQQQPYQIEQPSQYPTAVALHALQRTPQVVDCPMCGRREMTRTEAVTGKTTQYVTTFFHFVLGYKISANVNAVHGRLFYVSALVLAAFPTSWARSKT
jgi:predicted RNA-binding Zn-ribbon protein involved in translation (DUF1610 family)